MGFFANLFRDKAADAAKRRELDDFLEGLRAMDSDGRARLLSLVEHAEKALAAEKHIRPMHPEEAVKGNRNLCLDVSRIVHAIRRGHPEDADGYVVWLHTFRAVEDASLRDDVREMWQLLGASASEGFHAPEGC